MVLVVDEDDEGGEGEGKRGNGLAHTRLRRWKFGLGDMELNV